MASSLVQFRAKDTEKIKAVQILNRSGLSLPSYLRMYVSRLDQENGIPSSIKLDPEPNPSIRALSRANRTVEEYGISDMTLEEIDAGITKARK